MKYAVIKIKGKQYKITEGQEIVVDRLDKKKDESLTFSKVMLVRNDKEVMIGTPYVKDYRVNTKVMGEEKGEKIEVAKFKAKSRYRRKIGFRSKYTRLKISKIEKISAKPSSSKKKRGKTT